MAQLLDKVFIESLVLMNILTSTGWIRLTTHFFTIGKKKYAWYAICLAGYFLILAFIYWDAYNFHHVKLEWDLLTLSIIAGVVALIATFGFVIHSSVYESKPSRYDLTEA